MNPQKILIVEDDPAIGQSLLDGLKHHGFEAYLCTSGTSGVEHAKRASVLCLPRTIVRASGGDTTTVKVWNGVEEVTKEITIGLCGDTYVEIVSGLSEGEQMVTR